MSHDPHSHPAEEYNPERDYQRFMRWAKYGILICIAIIIALRFAIG